MSTPILPFAVWASGTNQNSIPANDNSLRNQILNGLIISKTTDAQPVSPNDGDIYIITGSATGGQWSTFDPDDLTIFQDGTWYAFAPVEGIVVNVAGSLQDYSGSSGYTPVGGGGATWGGIGGTLSDQTDLQSALNLKQSRSPSIQSVASAATVTPTFSNDMVKVTSQAVALDLANPTGTAIDGLGIVIRIKDNGTARAITYGTQYRAIEVTLPTTTVISKTTYLCMIFNSDDTKWDVVATGTEA